MSEYVDTQLLECNRLHSEEFKSGNNENPALFTNKLGSGINLDVGDVVSVHGCYVNENGAGGDTIEFKGASLGKFKEFTISNVSNTLPYEEGDVLGRLNGFKRTIIRDETIKRELFDNKASIKIGFYLNTMGQNTLQLPRRFAGRHIGNDSQNNFTQIDEIENGLPFYPKRILVGADYKEYWKSTSIFKQKIDNARFTIFARDTTVFNKDADFTYSASGREDVPNMWMLYGNQDLDPYTYSTIPRNPAFWKYKEYSQIVDLEVKEGFNSANNVAEQLTNQLKRPIKETEFKSRLYNDTVDKTETTIKTIETNSYKPFTAGSTGFMALSYSDDFYNGNASEKVETQSYDYLSCYQYVGHKRPEIQTAGRNLPTQVEELPWFGSHNYYTINKSASSTSPFVITIEYNASNCKKFDDFFKATELYPELWDNIDPRAIFGISSYNRDEIKYETSRWIHLNLHEAIVYTSSVGAVYLGGDNVQESGSGIQFEAPPLFFEYKSEFKDTFFEFPNRNKLSYGCMDKDIASGYIKFYPERAGGIPEFFFTGANTILGQKDFSSTGTGRQCGFDHSFSAWSTLAILPFAGYNLYNKNGTWQVGYQEVNVANFDIYELNGIANQVYIGSVDPKIEYDTIQNKFKISKLHSMLRQQQNSLAGASDDFPDLGSGVAGAEVYKLNPIDNYYTFTTDIIPYQDKKAHAGGSHAFEFTQFNLNLEPWQIYDSYGGIFIDDFGFDSDEGLWAVLGFTQNQINAPLTSENTLSNNRFDNISIQKLNKVTTNAEISSKDFSTYIQNVYGATMFTQQIVVPQAIFVNDIHHVAQNYFSPVTVEQTSVAVVAENLPRRMLRPYYLLKSNLIDNNSLIGSKDSGQNFNVAAIVDKQYSGGDFFFFNSNVVQFTITKPITLTSIQNSIHDPDGSFANVNEDSSVIYKIQKNRNLADLDILSQILQNRNQK